MNKGIKRMIGMARKNVEKEIRGSAGYNDEGGSLRQSFFARGISGEGFNGGYRAALDDVLLALNGNIPQRNGWWIKKE